MMTNTIWTGHGFASTIYQGKTDDPDDIDAITCTMVVEPPGTGGRRQFSGLPRPRLPRVTWNYGEPRGASENI